MNTLQQEQTGEITKNSAEQDEIGKLWSKCIDWYAGEEQGACVSIKNLPKLIGLIVEWKNHKLAQAIATARAEGAKEELKTKLFLMGLFHATLTDLYGKQLADEIMKRVNRNYEALTTKEHHAS